MTCIDVAQNQYISIVLASNITRPVHRTARYRVCFQNLLHLLIRWPAFPRLVPKSRHLIIDAFTLLQVWIFFQLSCRPCHQLLRSLRFCVLLCFLRYPASFGSFFRCCISLSVFLHTTIHFHLLLEWQGEEVSLGFEIQHERSIVQHLSGLSISFAYATLGRQI